jgi:hypothetical protein
MKNVPERRKETAARGEGFHSAHDLTFALDALSTPPSAAVGRDSHPAFGINRIEKRSRMTSRPRCVGAW